MNGEASTPAQLAGMSKQALVVVAFPKNRSPSYSIALEFLSMASSKSDTAVGRTVIHVGVFDHSAQQAEAVMSLLNYLDEIKGVQIYAGGRLRPDPETVTMVLRCFIQAETASDRSAYCHEVIDDPFPVRPDLDISRFSLDGSKRYLFPCALLRRHGLGIDADHPASAPAQIQAGAVRLGCDWCPHFDENNFREL